jgi:hypothetical protein
MACGLCGTARRVLGFYSPFKKVKERTEQRSNLDSDFQIFHKGKRIICMYVHVLCIVFHGPLTEKKRSMRWQENPFGEYKTWKRIINSRPVPNAFLWHAPRGKNEVMAGSLIIGWQQQVTAINAAPYV